MGPEHLRVRRQPGLLCQAHPERTSAATIITRLLEGSGPVIKCRWHVCADGIITGGEPEGKLLKGREERKHRMSRLKTHK